MSKSVIIIRNATKYDFGGGERFPVFLASSLQANGWQPTIISRSSKLLDFAQQNSVHTLRGWWWTQQNWSGIRATFFPLYVLWQLLLCVYYMVIFTRLQPGVVHLQSKDDFIAGTFAARLFGGRVVWTDHADLKHIWLNHNVWYKNPVGKLVYFAARYAHTITVVSESERKLVTSNLPSVSPVLSKIITIHNGVFDRRSDYTTRKPSPSTAVHFVIASRLVIDKGITEAVSAFSQLRNKYPKARLSVLGDGPDAEHFKGLPGASAVNFLGHVEQPLDYLAHADVFIHPTYHEGFSVALVEAAMMSLPTIATSVGGNMEIIQHEKTGLLVRTKDSQDLFDAMERMLISPMLRTQIGTAARKQYEERFEFNTIVRNQFIPVYEEGS